VKQIDIAVGDKNIFPSENPKIVPIFGGGSKPPPYNKQNTKLKFEAGYENSSRLLTKRAEYAILIHI
jgi:hypothetical protein